MSTHLLCVEDAPNIARLIEAVFGDEGMDVTTVEDGDQGLKLALSGDFDVILLDRRLPGASGLEIVSRLREEQVTTPVLMMTGRAGIADLVAGLEAGADDYVVKPFAVEELVARVRALLRRDEPSLRADQLEVLRAGPLELDTSARLVRRGDRRVDLTATEVDLLRILMRHPERVLSRRYLRQEIWDGKPEASNVVDVYIGYLRRKIDEPFEVPMIETVRGAGYRLRVPQPAGHGAAEGRTDG